MKSMTFNVLCAGKGENHWCRRQNLVKKIIELYDPDTFGLQEAHYGWMKYLNNQLKNKYAYVGAGKDDGNIKGEFSPVFYKKDKYEVIESGTFWLSETPEIPGLGWDAVENRTCSYALLKDKNTGEKIAHFNTHLDHIGETAINEGAKLVAQRANMFKDIPTVVSGDFNVTPDSEAYKIFLEAGFEDARSIAEKADNTDSFHWFGKGSKMIDFIFVKNANKIKAVKTATDKINGKLPSDHFPVVADIDL